MKIPFISQEIDRIDKKIEKLSQVKEIENIQSKLDTLIEQKKETPKKRVFVSENLKQAQTTSGSAFADRKKSRTNLTLYNKKKNDYGAYARASQDFLFHNNYISIKSLVFKNELEIKGKFKNGIMWYKEVFNFLQLEDLAESIFAEIYEGVTGFGLIYFYQSEFNFCPLYEKKERLIEKEDNHYIIKKDGKEIKVLEKYCHIVNEKMRQSFDTDLGSSVLGRVIDLIDLKFRIIEAQKKLACKDYQSDKFLSPNYGKFPKVSTDDQLTNTVNEVANNLNQLIDDLNSISNPQGTYAVPTPFDVTNISQTNAETKIIEVLRYIDEQLYLGCGLNGTFLNTDNSNRASAEQGMDNVRDTIVIEFQKIIRKCLEWCMIITDPEFRQKGYSIRFSINQTEETLKELDQALTVLEKVLPIVTKLGYKVKKESVSNVIGKFGLELEDEAPTEEVLQTEAPSINTKAVRALTEEELQSIPITQFSNIEKKTEYLKIKEGVKQKLSNQYDQFLESNKRIKVEDYNFQGLENFLSLELLNDYAQELKNMTYEDYQEEYQKEIKEELALKEKINNKIEKRVQETLKGNGDYKGTSETTAKKLQNESKKLLKDLNTTDQTLKDYLKSRKQFFIDDGFKRIEDGLFAYLYYDISSDIALDEGDDGVGQVSVNDNNVRPDHQLNHRRCWINGKKSPSGEVEPWKAYGDRCSYSFQAIKALLLQGFTK